MDYVLFSYYLGLLYVDLDVEIVSIWLCLLLAELDGQCLPDCASVHAALKTNKKYTEHNSPVNPHHTAKAAFNLLWRWNQCVNMTDSPTFKVTEF